MKKFIHITYLIFLCFLCHLVSRISNQLTQIDINKHQHKKKPSHTLVPGAEAKSGRFHRFSAETAPKSARITDPFRQRIQGTESATPRPDFAAFPPKFRCGEAKIAGGGGGDQRRDSGGEKRYQARRGVRTEEEIRLSVLTAPLIVNGSETIL